MANNQIVTPYDDAGLPAAAVKTTPVTLGGTTVIKNAPGRLMKVIVTTVTASAALTFYDSTSAASGTALLVVPAAAAAGTVYDVNLPAVNGVVAASSGATGNVTVAWS